MGISLRILIVEDSQDDVILLRHALRSAGYDVTCAAVDSPSAMRSAVEGHSWDIITSDHSMPRFSAPAALALAKELCPEVPFIILSGEIDLNLAVSLMRGGAKDYIQKRELARLAPAIERELKEAELRRERQRVDAALVESDNRLREVLENSLDASYKYNIQTKSYDYLGPVFTRISGYSPKEMKYLSVKAFYDLIHPDDLFETKRVLTESIAEIAKSENQVEYRFKHKKGHYLWLSDKYTVMRDASGLALAFIGSMSDITERKRMEVALREEDHLLKQMVSFTEELLKTGSDQVTYQKILENLLFLSKAKYGVLTLLNENTGKFSTVAVAGMNDGLKKVSQILGYDIIGKEWDSYSLDDEQLRKNIVTRFSSVSELAGAVIPKMITNALEKLFSVGELAVTKVFVEHQMIGDFTLIMPAGKHFENDSLVEIYSRQIDMFFTRIKPEKKLRESEEKYRSLIESSSDAIFCVDEKGQYQFTNHLFAVTFGKTPDYFIGKTFWDIYSKEYADHLYEIIKRVFQTRESQSFEIEVPAAGKTLYFYSTANPIKDEKGQVKEALIYAANITERKRASAELDVLLEILQGLVATKDLQEILALVHHAIAKVIYAENFFVVFYNKESGLFEEVYSVDKYDPPAPPSRLEKSITAYIYRSGKPEIMTQALFNKLEALGEVEMVGTNSASWLGAPLITSDGIIGVIVVQDYETPDRYIEGDKNFLAYVGSQVALAIERKQAEDQIKRLNAGLEKRVADRTVQLTAANQELEAFSYSVSHDLRAPLRALEGFSAVLGSDYRDQLGEEGQHYLTRIQEASRRMGQLIEDLLNLSRITRADMIRQQVDLSELAFRIAAELNGQSPQRRVNFEIASQMIVQADESLMKIVLENLLNNAYKFTSRCQLAVIQVDSEEREGVRTYFVRDNGAGFNMEYAHKLFGPFQRLHNVNDYPGIGIGLATVQRIIHRHGGRVWAEGVENQGATFYFIIGA